MAGQLVLPLGTRPRFSRQDFIAAPCNEQALRFVESWPDWPVRAAALYGPAGCGKTHLATIWMASSQGVELALQTSGEGTPAEPDRSTLLPDDLPEEAVVLIEDIDRLEPAIERDRLLMSLFERPRTMLLLTGRARPKDWPVALADVRSRFDALLDFPIWAPDEVLIGGLIRKLFADRQLEVPEKAVQRILSHVERSPSAVEAFVARIDAKALSEKRAITERLVMDVIEAEQAR